MRYMPCDTLDRIDAEFEMTLLRDDDSEVKIETIGNYTRIMPGTFEYPEEGGKFEITAVYTVPEADEIYDGLSPREKGLIIAEANNHYPEGE